MEAPTNGIELTGTLYTSAQGDAKDKLAYAELIWDNDLQKYQSDINKESSSAKVSNLLKYLICTDEQDIDVDKDFAVLMKDGTYFVVKDIDWLELGRDWYKDYTFADPSVFENLWESEYVPKFSKIISLGDITKVNNLIRVYANILLPEYINSGKDSEGRSNPIVAIDTAYFGNRSIPYRINGLGIAQFSGVFLSEFKGDFLSYKFTNSSDNSIRNNRLLLLYQLGFPLYNEEFLWGGTPKITINTKDYQYLLIQETNFPLFNIFKVNDLTNTLTGLQFSRCVFEKFKTRIGDVAENWNPIFSRVTKISELFKECYFYLDVDIDLTEFDFSNVTEARLLFLDTRLVLSVKISLPVATNVSNIFALAPDLKEVTITELGPVRDCGSMFYDSPKLLKVSINMSNANKALDVFNVPSWSSVWLELTDVTLTGLKEDSDLTYLIALSDESIARILNEAATVTTPKTLTINTHIYNRLTLEQISNFEAKGWTLAHTTNAKCDAAYNLVVVSHGALESVKAELEDKVNTVKDGFKVEGETLTINI